MFIFARRCLLSEKQPINLLTQSESFATLNRSKKKRLTLHRFYLLLQRKNLIEYQNQKNVFGFLRL